MLRFRTWIMLATLAWLVGGADALAQSPVTQSDSITQKQTRKQKREPLSSDTLPSVMNHRPKVAATDTTKKKRRTVDASYYRAPHPYSTTNPSSQPSTPPQSTPAAPALNVIAVPENDDAANASATGTDTLTTRKRRSKKATPDSTRAPAGASRQSESGNAVETTIDVLPKPFEQPSISPAASAETVQPDASSAGTDTTTQRQRERRRRVAQTDAAMPHDTLPPLEPLQLTPEQKAAQLFDVGSHFLNKGGYFEATRYFDSIVSFYPNTFPYKQAYYFRGLSRLGWGNEEGAEQDFRFFNQLDQCASNFCTDAHYQLALLRFRAGRCDEAMQDLQPVLRDSTYKNHKFGFFYRAFCRAEKEQYIPAIQDLTVFLQMDGGRTFASAEAYYYRGFYKARQQDHRGAIADYDKAIQLYEAGLNAKSGTQYRQKLIDTYIVRALAKAEIRKYDDAIADYNIVIRLNPGYATAHRLKGLAEIGKGDKDNGCLSLSRAGELGANEAYDDIKLHCR